MDTTSHKATSCQTTGAARENGVVDARLPQIHARARVGRCEISRLRCRVWVLHIAKVAYFFSSSLLNVEWAILEPLPFFFYQKLFIFRFLENCF